MLRKSSKAAKQQRNKKLKIQEPLQSHRRLSMAAVEIPKLEAKAGVFPLISGLENCIFVICLEPFWINRLQCYYERKKSIHVNRSLSGDCYHCTIDGHIDAHSGAGETAGKGSNV